MALERSVNKFTMLPVGQYDGFARLGELVVDITVPAAPALYVGNATGNVIAVSGGGGGGSPGGSPGQIQFNSGGTFGGSPALTFDGANMAVGGNVTATNFIGNFVGNIGGATSNVAANVITANTGNIGVINSNVITANGNVTGGNLVTGGNVYANSGNVFANGVYSNVVTANGNVTAGNLVTPGNVYANSGNVFANGVYSNVVTANGNVTAGNLVTPGNVYANSGNVFANGVYANTGNIGNLNVTGNANLGPVGNIYIGGGTAGQVLTTNGSGGLSWTTVGGGGGTYGDSNVTTLLGAFGSNTITTTGNITAGNFIGTTSNVSGNSNVGGNLNVAGSAAITGNLTVTGNISGNFAAPGTNTQVIFNDAGIMNAVSGMTFNKVSSTLTAANLTVSGVSTLGPASNVRITGGTTGQFLQTDGTGTLTWASATATPPGTNTQVLFNDAGAIGADAGMTYNKASTRLTVTNFVINGTSILGSNSSITITGGTNGQFLRTNGAGTLSWADAGVTVPGSNTQVIFNDGGVLGADAGMTYNKTTDTLSPINLSVSGTANFYTTSSNAVTNPAMIVQNGEELVRLVGTGATGTINFDCQNSVQLTTVNAAANWTMNFRFNANTSMANVLIFDSANSISGSMTVVHMVQQGASAFRPTAFQVDGVAVTPIWQGGTAPTTGNANSVDVYSYTIIRTGTSTYSVLASQTQFR